LFDGSKWLFALEGLDKAHFQTFRIDFDGFLFGFFLVVVGWLDHGWNLGYHFRCINDQGMDSCDVDREA